MAASIFGADELRKLQTIKVVIDETTISEGEERAVLQEHKVFGFESALKAVRVYTDGTTCVDFAKCANLLSFLFMQQFGGEWTTIIGKRLCAVPNCTFA